MTNNDETRVIFIQVNNAATKVRHLAQTAPKPFFSKEHFLIIADDDQALAFVDGLLWSHTPDIFLPHSIVSDDTRVDRSHKREEEPQ